MPPDFLYPEETYLLIGKIIEPNGLKGEVTVLSYAGQPENFRQYSRLSLVTPAGQLYPDCDARVSRVNGKKAILRLGISTDRTTAESLTGMGVLLRKENLPHPGKDEFYLYQLEGLLVVTDDGRQLGHVQHIFFNGAQNILVVVDGKKEYLIPALQSLFIYQDTEKIIIAPPPGLLDINAGDESE